MPEMAVACKGRVLRIYNTRFDPLFVAGAPRFALALLAFGSMGLALGEATNATTCALVGPTAPVLIARCLATFHSPAHCLLLELKIIESRCSDVVRT
ncbi:hypothetical protein [Ralstonia phage phiRSL1]|uniref:Uncharacterized protein n=1 Tax=Ralstonia phage phiRSL1 TaxID=1980924 RepID=B2ZXS5_9CAUD|nr:hypothetical protein RSL1_ORF060 [Ralstonia phage phiRSL1]BAG41506.1 hypothetical protein [Ralstonia phage phiRSL1]